jgi:hypothetical protein
MKWKVYYDNGNTFSDLDGLPEDAPCRGVQAIVRTDPDVGRRICRTDNFYVFDTEWKGVDQFGLYDYLSDTGLKIVKFGRTIGDREYEAVLSKAVNDPDFPRKSAFTKDERR